MGCGVSHVFCNLAEPDAYSVSHLHIVFRVFICRVWVALWDCPWRFILLTCVLCGRTGRLISWGVGKCPWWPGFVFGAIFWRTAWLRQRVVRTLGTEMLHWVFAGPFRCIYTGNGWLVLAGFPFQYVGIVPLFSGEFPVSG